MGDLGFYTGSQGFERSFASTGADVDAIFARFDAAPEPMVRQAASMDSVP